MLAGKVASRSRGAGRHVECDRKHPAVPPNRKLLHWPEDSFLASAANQQLLTHIAMSTERRNCTKTVFEMYCTLFEMDFTDRWSMSCSAGLCWWTVVVRRKVKSSVTWKRFLGHRGCHYRSIWWMSRWLGCEPVPASALVQESAIPRRETRSDWSICDKTEMWGEKECGWQWLMLVTAKNAPRQDTDHDW